MRVDVLYQFNEKYVPYAGISITSLLENNKEIEEIVIHLMLEEVSDESKEQLLKLANYYNRKIIFIETQKLIQKMKSVGINEYRGSYATNMKIFAPMYMDESVKRLLYIDSDTIINGKISELISLNMHDKPIAMALDSLGGKHKLQVGLNEEDLYFNGGIILFDIERWKETECEKRIINHVKNVRSHYMAPDQDLINIVLRGEIGKLDIKYNLQPIHMVYDTLLYNKYFKQKNYYNKEEIKNAVADPVILHTFRFLGEFPWHNNSLHPGVLYFDKYMKMSLWKNYKKIPTEQNGLIFKIERLLYRHLPQQIFLSIFKLNYEIFLWKANRDSLRNRNNKNM